MLTDWPFEGLTPCKYGAILVDPPWAYKMRSPKGYAKSPEAHYRTMSIDKIKALPVSELATKDCRLFMWSTWPHLRQAMDVMTAWGVSYVTGGAWIKRTKDWKLAMGTGFVMRSSCEPFLIGRFGEPAKPFRAPSNVIVADEDLPDMIEGLRREHSRKPPEMRRLIELAHPEAFCCELFAREPWPGHDVWGNETGKFEEPV